MYCKKVPNRLLQVDKDRRKRLRKYVASTITFRITLDYFLVPAVIPLQLKLTDFLM